jgi:ATP-dependent Lon protease
MPGNNDDLLNTIASAQEQGHKNSIPKKLTILPLRDFILFPHMIFPVLIGRSSSLKAVAEALERDKFIFVSAQKDSSIEDPAIKDIYTHGTVAKVLQVLRLPNNLLKVLVEGVFQARITTPSKNKEFLEANVHIIKAEYDADDTELQAFARRAGELFTNYVKANRNLPPEIIAAFDNIEDLSRKLYYAAANVNKKVPVKQQILEQNNLKDQYRQLVSILNSEIEVLKLEEELDTKVNDTIHKTQRKFYIQEQIRALQKELEGEEEATPELAKLKDLIVKAQMPEAVHTRAMEEFDKLRKTPSMSPEYSVIRTYLETLASLPWTQETKDELDLQHVRSILDEDHYDLEKPKERILEFISVLRLAGNAHGQILCLSGPPGVGKTSLGKSIARALGRKFVRISLGGVRDEAEIRGHRRTYIGALPGKIISAMKKAGTVNPVILLDEVDKMSMDFRGDPSAALLEVLDPEQNNTFSDHYLEVEYDLSKVLFITTANVKFDIPGPLLDRMEVIDVSSYLDFDKLQIARNHILPKLLKEFGMEGMQVSLQDDAILKIITEYTREAGVRNLEREIASVLRKVAKEIVLEQSASVRKKKKVTKAYTIQAADIEKYLKVPRFRRKDEDLTDRIGVATGLAWTSVGGDTLPVEVSIMPGGEKLTLTGKLGDVMKESATAALTYVRSNWKNLAIPEEFSKGREIHIHVPEGAIPKDGPSAGITMTLALVSAASGMPLRGDIAMTGEVTLRGNILPIGGLNEKLLAAKRVGIHTVLIPKGNEKDIAEVNPVIRQDMTIIPVQHITEALPLVFRGWKTNSTAAKPSQKGAGNKKAAPAVKSSQSGISTTR